MIPYQHPNTEFTRQRLRKLTLLFQSKQINDRLALLGCGSILFTWPRIAFNKNQPAGGIASVSNSEIVGKRQAFFIFSWSNPWNLKPSRAKLSWLQTSLGWAGYPARLSSNRPSSQAPLMHIHVAIVSIVPSENSCGLWNPEIFGVNVHSLPVSLIPVVLGTGLFCFHCLHSCEDILSQFFGKFNCQSTRYSIW